MASKKKDLAGLLGEAQAPPVLRRGQGLRLSTEAPTGEVVPPPKDPAPPRARKGTAPPAGARAAAPPAPAGEPKRVSRGYKLRADLVKACKRLALEEDRNLYEVMEEALEMYLARKARAPR